MFMSVPKYWSPDDLQSGNIERFRQMIMWQEERIKMLEDLEVVLRRAIADLNISRRQSWVYGLERGFNLRDEMTLEEAREELERLKNETSSKE